MQERMLHLTISLMLTWNYSIANYNLIGADIVIHIIVVITNCGYYKLIFKAPRNSLQGFFTENNSIFTHLRIWPLKQRNNNYSEGQIFWEYDSGMEVGLVWISSQWNTTSLYILPLSTIALLWEIKNMCLRN